MPNGTSVSDQVFTIERNPYYFAVDAEGNQLPYIDEVRFTFFADNEALNLAAVGGEIDMQGRHINMSAYPVLKENEEQGNYHVVTWPTFGGSDAVLMFNQTYVDDPAIGELLQNKDFRIAMSHAIDREAIKELAFLGLGEARQGVPAPFHPYYPGDEVAFKFTELDPDTANELLDGIGLTERDDEGFRTAAQWRAAGPGNQRRACLRQLARCGQIVVENWADVGVRARIEIRERTLHFAMRDTSDLMIEIWNEDTTGFPFSGQPKMDPRSNPALAFAPLVRQWIETDGAEGVEPTPEIAQLMEIIDEAKLSGRDRQIELAQELFTHLGRQPLGNRHRRPDADDSGCGRGQRQPDERARGGRQRLAAAHARQHPTGAVLLPAVIVLQAATADRWTAVVACADSSSFATDRLAAKPAQFPARQAIPSAARMRGQMRNPRMTSSSSSACCCLPLLLFIFSVFVFFIIQAPPGDFVTSYIAELAASGSSVDQAQAEALRNLYGLDQPLYVQYVKWMGRLAHRRSGRLAGLEKTDRRTDRRALDVDGLAGRC